MPEKATITSYEASKEPDLTPMLDVVFLLIFFFAMTADFVQKEQNFKGITLPVAQFAGPLDEKVDNYYFLNLDEDGNLVGLSGAQTKSELTSELQKKAYVNELKLELESYAKNKRIETTDLLIILRADKYTRYSDVWSVLDMCNQAGFSKWQIRVLRGNT